MARTGGSILGVVVAHRLLENPIARALDRPVEVSIPDKGDRVRVASWNLRNYPDAHDDAYVQARIEALDADVVGLQELRDPTAAARLLPGHTLHVSNGGGRNGQRVGLAWRTDVVALVDGPHEHTSMTMKGRVRPALSAQLRHRGSGTVFTIVVVHLKATPDGYTLRQQQWSRLRAVLDDTGRDRASIVLGDFNVTGARGSSPEVELAELEAGLGAVGLRRVDVVGGCTAYWDGVRHDAWQEPSLLDLVWIRPSATLPLQGLEARSWGHCARYACRPFRSTEAYPDVELLRASDHCPVTVDVPMGRSIATGP